MSKESWSKKELATLRNVDRLLPSQPYFSKEYIGCEAEYFQRLQDLILSPHEHQSVESKLDLTLKDGVTYASLGSELGTLYFYQFLIGLTKAQTVLELGTYIGVSAMYLAEAVGDTGQVITVECGQEFYEIAKGNIERNGYSDRIAVLHDDALATLAYFITQKNKFDLILIDAAKESYTVLLQNAIHCLNEGGMILVDDIFFQGDTLNDKPTTEKGQGVKEMIDYANTLHDYNKVILPIGNGLMMLTKKRMEPVYHGN